jgi:hypothetical protein
MKNIGLPTNQMSPSLRLLIESLLHGTAVEIPGEIFIPGDGVLMATTPGSSLSTDENYN